MVVCKTTFQPIRVYRNLVSLNDVNGEEIGMVTYDASIFKHSVEMSKYIFAKMGLIKGLQFLGLDGVFMINNHPINDDKYYSFLIQEDNNMILFSKIQLNSSLINDYLSYHLNSLLRYHP